jgi:hypothetical protein
MLMKATPSGPNPARQGGTGTGHSASPSWEHAERVLRPEDVPARVATQQATFRRLAASAVLAKALDALIAASRNPEEKTFLAALRSEIKPDSS